MCKNCFKDKVNCKDGGEDKGAGSNDFDTRRGL